MTDERGGRYFREARFFLAGDKVAAQSHILEARSLMGYMRDQHAMGGPPIQVKYATLQDGTQIKAVMMNGQYQAEIVSPKPIVTAVKKACEEFQSGLLSIEHIGEYTRQTPAGEETYEALEWLHPSEYHQDTYDVPAAKFAVEKFATYTLSYEFVYASAYSGAMRQAIQLLLGMGYNLVTVGFGGFAFAYEYTFGYAGTHGLVRKHGYTDDSPEFWLVRMPTGGRGLLATDFKICTAVTEAQKAAGVHWVPDGITRFPDDLDAALEDGTVLELVSADDFATETEYYQPMYSDCGWAFSLSGHECQNVVYRVEELVPEVDYRVYTKRVKVAFTVTAPTDESPAGISASVSSTEPSVFFGGISSIPRYPWLTPTMVSMFPTYDAYAAPHPTFTGSVNCDVHVYYKGDTAQVFQYVVDKSSETASWDEGNYFNLILPMASGYIPRAGSYTGISHYPGTAVTYYALNGVAINNHTYSGNGLEYHLDITESAYSGAEYVIGNGAITGWMQAFRPTAVIGKENEYVETFSGRANHVLLDVPFHQREAVYVLDAQSSDNASHTVWGGAKLGMATSGESWELYGVQSTECPLVEGTDYHSVKIRITNAFSHSPYLDSAELGAPYYPDLPTSQFYYTPINGGLGLTALQGCEGEIVTDAEYVYAAATPTVVPDQTVWSGGLKFISSGGQVEIPFGTATGPVPDNAIFQRVTYITSTAYIGQGTITFIHGWTDGVKPEKYVVFKDINTYNGEDAITNTGYPVEDMNAWGKSFIGIAN